MCFCAAQAQNNPQHGWHTYCTNEFNNAIGGPVPFTIATCYPPDMAINYAGTAITKVAMYSDTLYNVVGGIYTCSIYVGGDSPYDGILASTTTVDVPQSLGDWAEFDLDTPVWVTGNLSIWVVWETVQQLTAWPMGVCEGNDPSGDGHWIWGGHQWEHSNYGDWTVKTYFSWDEPQPQVPDVYFTGNNNIWKNDMLFQSISDTVLVDLTSLQVAPDRTVYSAGYSHDSTYDFLQGRIWLNDSIMFNAGNNNVINKLILNGSQWTAAGFGENIWEGVDGLVWQDGEVLYAYGDSISNNQIVALAIDTLTGDIYTGGVTGESNPHAAVWKNDTLLWSAEWLSEVHDIAFDGTDFYAAGSLYFEGIRATLWQNDSIIFQISADDSEFSAIALYNGSVYLGGYKDDTLFVWQDGEVLYSHPFSDYSSINAMVVNEFGVYYAGQIDGMATVWKDGEVLYQPEGCDNITSLAVLPPEPTPEYTITLESANPDWAASSEVALILKAVRYPYMLSPTSAASSWAGTTASPTTRATLLSHKTAPSSPRLAGLNTPSVSKAKTPNGAASAAVAPSTMVTQRRFRPLLSMVIYFRDGRTATQTIHAPWSSPEIVSIEPSSKSSLLPSLQ